MGLIKTSAKEKKSKKDPAISAANMGVGAVGGSAGGLLGASLATLPLAAPFLLKKDFARGQLSEEETNKLLKLFGKENIEIQEGYKPHESHYNDVQYEHVTNPEPGKKYKKVRTMFGKVPVNVVEKEYVRAPRDSYILAHELGHATGPIGAETKLPKWLKNIYGAGYTAGSVGGRYGLTGLAAAARAVNKERTGEDNAALQAADYAGRLGTATMLGEEAQASLRGLKNIYKIQGLKGATKALGTLAPAYGTYAAIAAGNHLLAPYLAKKIYHSREADNNAD